MSHKQNIHITFKFFFKQTNICTISKTKFYLVNDKTEKNTSVNLNCSCKFTSVEKNYCQGGYKYYEGLEK